MATFIALKLQISFCQVSWQNIGEHPYVYKRSSIQTRWHKLFQPASRDAFELEYDFVHIRDFPGWEILGFKFMDILGLSTVCMNNVNITHLNYNGTQQSTYLCRGHWHHKIVTTTQTPRWYISFQVLSPKSNPTPDSNVNWSQLRPESNGFFCGTGLCAIFPPNFVKIGLIVFA